MPYRLSYGTVRVSQRQAIYVVRVHDDILTRHEIDDVAARMQDRLESRGELTAEVVVLQGHSRETFRAFGSPYAVARVRVAIFNAAVSWAPIELY